MASSGALRLANQVVDLGATSCNYMSSKCHVTKRTKRRLHEQHYRPFHAGQE